MKIGYFTAHFPYESRSDNFCNSTYTQGGASSVSYDLARGMAKRGHQVVVFTSSADLRTSTATDMNMVLYRYGTIFRILTAHIPLRIFFDPLKHNVDLVHAHFSIFPAADAALLYSRIKGIPMVITYHGESNLSYGPFFRKAVLSFYNRFLLDEILSHAKAIIIPSSRVLEDSKSLQLYAHKTIQIPNGVDIAAFDIPYSKEYCRKSLGLQTRGPVILFVGALVSIKGPQILLKALPKVVNVHPDAMLVIVGEGYSRKKLHKLALELGVDKHVQFAGLVRKELPMYLKSSDVFVLPSFQENLPLAVLEAMAAGIPVIASAVGGIRDLIIDGKTGLSVQPGNIDALADALVRLLEEEDLRNQMSGRAKKLVQNYSWERVTEETEKLYRHLLYD